MKYKLPAFRPRPYTLDYETNSREALSELYIDFGLNKKGIEEEKFLQTFYVINNELWDQYDRGLLHRDVIRNERFHRILLALGLMIMTYRSGFLMNTSVNRPKRRT